MWPYDKTILTLVLVKHESADASGPRSPSLSGGARSGILTPDPPRRPIRTLHGHARRAAEAFLPRRRLRIHLPGLPRVAADDAAGRHTGQRRLRRHQHAAEADRRDGG